MFNLTKRQLICFALAAAAGVPIFFLTKPSLGISTSAMLMVVIMLPFIFFALYEKDGQPAEKILGHVIKSMFLRDKVRPYRTNNLYAAIQQEIKEKEELQIAQQHEKGRSSLSGLPKTARCTAIFSPLRKRRSWSCRRKRPRRQKKVRKSAQQTIPYVEMCRDGICKVNSRLYTKTIRFNDINYQLAQNEDKTAIFENWCDFLNYFDSSIFVQFSFINQRTSISEFKKQTQHPRSRMTSSNDIRSEYSEMLQNQLTKGNNGLIKRKYITFGIEADSLRMAKAKLDRIENGHPQQFQNPRCEDRAAVRLRTAESAP